MYFPRSFARRWRPQTSQILTWLGDTTFCINILVTPPTHWQQLGSRSLLWSSTNISVRKKEGWSHSMSPKLNYWHAIITDPGFQWQWMEVPSGRSHTMSAYSDSTWASNGTCRYDPSLKILEKWSVPHLQVANSSYYQSGWFRVNIRCIRKKTLPKHVLYHWKRNSISCKNIKNSYLIHLEEFFTAIFFEHHLAKTGATMWNMVLSHLSILQLEAVCIHRSFRMCLTSHSNIMMPISNI